MGPEQGFCLTQSLSAEEGWMEEKQQEREESA